MFRINIFKEGMDEYQGETVPSVQALTTSIKDFPSIISFE